MSNLVIKMQNCAIILDSLGHWHDLVPVFTSECLFRYLPKKLLGWLADETEVVGRDDSESNFNYLTDYLDR